MRVLIIEDSEHASRLLSHVVRAVVSDAEVQQAMTLKEASDALEEPFDVILWDYEMMQQEWPRTQNTIELLKREVAKRRKTLHISTSSMVDSQRRVIPEMGNVYGKDDRWWNCKKTPECRCLECLLRKELAPLLK